MSEAELKEIENKCFRGHELEAERHYSLESGCDSWLELRKIYESALSQSIPKLIAEIRRLQKQLADAPIVYGRKYGTGWLTSGEYQQSHDTHTARLIDIKKIGEGE